MNSNPLPFDPSQIPIPKNAAEFNEYTRTALEAVYKGLYSVPLIMGYGEWWKLSDADANALTDHTINAINAVPSKKRKAVKDALDKYMPISALCGTLIMTTWPKIVMTQIALAQAQRGGNNVVFPPRPPDNATAGADANPAGRDPQNQGPNETRSASDLFGSRFQ